MVNQVKKWLINAHNNFPELIKAASRGGIYGGLSGLVLSFGYSMLFGFPFALIVYLDNISRTQTNETGALLEGFSVLSDIFNNCVYPSIIIGLVSGGITGLLIFYLKKFRRSSNTNPLVLSLVFWAPIVVYASTQVIPKLVIEPWQQNDPLSLRIFIYYPSILFVMAMAFVAYKTTIPIIRSTESS